MWELGLAQCVLWGVLYYSFPVLMLPMEHALGLSRTAVAGAFSLALLAMAVAAPLVGRWLDAGRQIAMLRTGTALAAVGLVTLALARGPVAFYFAWLVIGLSMSMLLYEAAFALVIRAIAQPRERLHALAAVTVFGGLASTLFVPLLGWVAARWDWRAAVGTCLVALVFAAWRTETRVIPALPARTDVGRASVVVPARGRWPVHLPTLATLMSLGTLASMAMTTLLIPLLVARGTAPATAALLLGALGAAQVPGRLWLMRERPAPPRGLHVGPLALQAAGLVVVVAATPTWASALGVAMFGLGAGLQTVARPWLVQRLYGEVEAGRWNGEVARVQGLARAAGPAMAAAAAAWLGGIPAVFLALGLVLLLGLPLARRLPV